MIIKHELISFDTYNCYFNTKVDEKTIAKYLKGVYRENKSRFKSRFVDFFKTQFKAYDLEYFNDIIDNIDFFWDKVNPFTYQEAFEIEDVTTRALFFRSVNINEMVSELGATRINVEGKELVNKVWNEYKNEFEEVPYTVVYELYHINGSKLGLNEEVKLPIVKCWCTTTNDEHWLWVDSESFSDNSPLQAIASTCVIYKSMHNKIKHIIRQGDVFIFEMIEDVMPSENEETMSLSMNEYFKLLKSQA